MTVSDSSVAARAPVDEGVGERAAAFSRSVVFYITSVALLSVAVGALSLVFGVRPQVAPLLILCALGVLSFNLREPNVGSRIGFSFLSIILLASASILGPFGAWVVGLVSVSVVRRKTRWFQRCFNIAMTSIIGAAGAWAYVLARGASNVDEVSGLGSLVVGVGLPLIVADVVQCLTNAVLLSGVMHFYGGAPFGVLVRRILTTSGVAYVGYGVIGFLFVILWFPAKLGPFSALLVIVPLLAARWAFIQYGEERRSHERTIDTLVTALGRKDPGAVARSRSSARVAEWIAEELALAPSQIATVRYAATLHELGRLGVPTRLLRHPLDTLTESERRVLGQHCAIGARMIEDIDFLEDARSGIQHQNEHYDGTGGPRRAGGPRHPGGGSGGGRGGSVRRADRGTGLSGGRRAGVSGARRGGRSVRPRGARCRTSGARPPWLGRAGPGRRLMVAHRGGQRPTMVLGGVGLVVADVAAVSATGPAVWSSWAVLAVLATFGVVIVLGECFALSAPGLRGSAPISMAAAFGLCFVVELPEVGRLPYGALVIIAVSGTAMAIGLVLRRASGRSASVVESTGRFVAVVVAALLYRTVHLKQDGPSPAPVDGLRPWQLAVLLLGIAAVALLADLLFTATAHTAPAIRNLRRLVFDEVRSSVALSTAVAVTGVLIALASLPLGIAALPLFLAPLVLTQFAFRRYLAIRATYLQSIRTLSRLTDVAGYTPSGHSERVASLSVSVGRELGLPERALLDLEYAALLHDIGQVALVDPIPGGATVLAAPADQRRIEADTVAIVRETGVLDDVAIILEHQTTPYRQVRELGEQIPLTSRIVKVVNAYEDLTAGARTRRARENALERIYLGLGYEYDPRVVDALQRALAASRPVG